jgi:hypothetical protein
VLAGSQSACPGVAVRRAHGFTPPQCRVCAVEWFKAAASILQKYRRGFRIIPADPCYRHTSTDGEKTMPNDSGTEINSYTMNKDYDLVSVLYHALQAADTCAQYQQDAESEGSPEVAEFMRDVQEQNTRIAQQAKELLLKQQQI